MDIRVNEDIVQDLVARPELEPTDSDAWRWPASIATRFTEPDSAIAYANAAKFLNPLFERMDRVPDRILDFGCGMGRVMRVLSRTPGLKNTELHGCDINAQGLEATRRTVPHCFLSKSTPLPPLIYRDGVFDLIYACSVFSHLSAESHEAFANEFRRICTKGAFVCVTTHGAWYYERFVLNPNFDLGERTKGLQTREAFERWSAGEFVFAAERPEWPHYGHAAAPLKYFEKVWCPLGFEIIGWDDNPRLVGQDVCTMRLN